MIDGAALRDGAEPSLEAAAGVVGVARAVQGQQNVLNDVLDTVRPDAGSANDAPHEGDAGLEQSLVGGPVPRLRGRHQGRPPLIGRSVAS